MRLVNTVFGPLPQRKPMHAKCKGKIYSVKDESRDASGAKRTMKRLNTRKERRNAKKVIEESASDSFDARFYREVLAEMNRVCA